MQMHRLLTLIIFSGIAFFLIAAQTPIPELLPADIESRLSEALTQRLQSQPETQSVALDLFTPELDRVILIPDGKAAVLWLALRDDNGHKLATEPGLALARFIENRWQVLLPGDTGWSETLSDLPVDMLPLEQRPAPAGVTINSSSIQSTLTDYYLPYAAGTAHWLEGSISHFQYIPELGYPSCNITYCHYAYDFTDVGHYPLLASKSGTVVASRDSCSDGDSNCTNYIVLYNASDAAYQIYLHMSHGTIPDKLTNGTNVQRGQYLGDTDDTGYSTSNHVHFMVTESIWQGSDGYYWGQSVDVRFADVAINNGIPRTCYEVTHFAIYDGATDCLGNKADPLNPANDWYISGNTGAYPPTGTLTRPAAGATVASGSNPIMDVTAAVNDDVQVTAVRVVAKLNGQWVEIGPRVTQPEQPGIFDWDVNLCAVGPLNGSLEVALRAWDYEGNVAATLNPHTIYVDHACPPPTSQLNPAVTFNSSAVQLNWDGSSAGAGLASFQLQWRSDTGTWDAAHILTFAASQHSTWFVGQPGTGYAFRLRAVDSNGQLEDWPANDAPETTASIPSTCSLDQLETNDDSNHATAMVLGVAAVPNLCPSGNLDWFQFKIEQKGNYGIWAFSQNGGAAVKITAIDSNSQTVLAASQAAGIGQSAFVFLRLDAGSYYIKVEPLVPDLSGTDAIYRLLVTDVKQIFLPVVAR